MRGLPSLRALDEDAAGGPRSRLWLALEPTDMRCGFDRLAERVRTVIGQDPLSGHDGTIRTTYGGLQRSAGSCLNFPAPASLLQVRLYSKSEFKSFCLGERNQRSSCKNE